MSFIDFENDEFDAWNVFFGQEKKIFFDAVLNVLFLAANFGKTSNKQKKKECVVCSLHHHVMLFVRFFVESPTAWCAAKARASIRSRTARKRRSHFPTSIGLTCLVRRDR